MLRLANHTTFFDFRIPFSAWVFLGSLSLAPFHTNQPLDVYWAPVLLLLAAVLAFLERLKAREPVPLLVGHIVAAMVLFLCFVFVDAGKFGDEIRAFGTIIFIAFICPMLIVVQRVRTIEQVHTLLLAWVLGGCLCAVLTIAYCNQWIQHTDFYWTRDRRASAWATHPNRLGLICMLTLPVLLYFFLRSANLMWRVLCLLGFWVVIKTTDYSGSRAAMVGIMAVVSLVAGFYVLREAVFREYDTMLKALMISVSILAVLLAGHAMGWKVPIVSSVLDRLATGSSYSDWEREIFFQRSLNGFLEYPFFGEGVRRTGVLTSHHVSHNSYMQLLNSFGVFGAIAMFYVLTRPIVLMAKKYFKQIHQLDLLTITLLGAGCAYLIWLIGQPGWLSFEVVLFTSLMLHLCVWDIRARDRARTSVQGHARPIATRVDAEGRQTDHSMPSGSGHSKLRSQ